MDSLVILDLLSGHMAHDAVLEDLKVWGNICLSNGCKAWPRLLLIHTLSSTLQTLPQEPGRFPCDGPIASLKFPHCKGQKLEEAKQVRHMMIQVKI